MGCGGCSVILLGKREGVVLAKKCQQFPIDPCVGKSAWNDCRGCDLLRAVPLSLRDVQGHFKELVAKNNHQCDALCVCGADMDISSCGVLFPPKRPTCIAYGRSINPNTVSPAWVRFALATGVLSTGTTSTMEYPFDNSGITSWWHRVTPFTPSVRLIQMVCDIQRQCWDLRVLYECAGENPTRADFSATSN